MTESLINIDGSSKSGSGTIVRYGISLASILGKPLHITNIRAKRRKPGLRPQHLKTVQACAQLTGGHTENAVLNSSEITYSPGKTIKDGTFTWDIGTAGSTTMMALCLLPLGLFAKASSTWTIKGGLFQDFAPNVFHMKYVLLPILRKFSVDAAIEVIKPGYVPTGGGIIKINVNPVQGKLKPLHLTEQGKVTAIKGIAISSHLKERNVSQRMADTCNEVLKKSGYHADIETIYDSTADQRGAALLIYALTNTGCIIGSDMAGKLGRTSEEIGRRVAKKLLKDLESGATVDRYTADQIIIYAALADGESEFLIPGMTEHIDSNLWLGEKLLGVKFALEGNKLRIN